MRDTTRDKLSEYAFGCAIRIKQLPSHVRDDKAILKALCPVFTQKEYGDKSCMIQQSSIVTAMVSLHVGLRFGKPNNLIHRKTVLYDGMEKIGSDRIEPTVQVPFSSVWW